MTSRTSPQPAPRRNPVVVTIDIIASVVLVLFGAVLALGVVTTAVAYGGLHAECGAGPYEGLVCNPVALGAVVYGLMGVVVFAFFIGLGMVIVSLIRKRLTFWWPLGAIVITIVVFYIGTWVAGMTVA